MWGESSTFLLCKNLIKANAEETVNWILHLMYLFFYLSDRTNANPINLASTDSSHRFIATTKYKSTSCFQWNFTWCHARVLRRVRGPAWRAALRGAGTKCRNTAPRRPGAGGPGPPGRAEPASSTTWRPGAPVRGRHAPARDTGRLAAGTARAVPTPAARGRTAGRTSHRPRARSTRTAYPAAWRGEESGQGKARARDVHENLASWV